MAWSSLSSNEIPTKSEVQEAINSGSSSWKLLYNNGSNENTTTKQYFFGQTCSTYMVVIGGMRIAPVSLLIHPGGTIRFWTVGNGTGYGCFALQCTSAYVSLSHLHDSNFFGTIGIQLVWGM